jgi:cellobiose-specific phosphotransferase system component IIB
MKTILLIARSGLGTATIMLSAKAKSQTDPKQRDKFKKVAQALTAAQAAIDSLLVDPVME